MALSQQVKAKIGFLAMCIGTFMAVLDSQIVSSSLPEIAASLGATLEEASWIQTSYMVAEVIMIPLTGWLSRSLSLRYLYSIACLLFTLTSMLCATAWSIESIVFIRVLQGMSAGLLAPLLYQGIYLLFPPQERSTTTLYVVLAVSLAPIIGPTFGGWITQNWSWQWLFLLNLLPGLLVSSTVFGLVRVGAPNLSLLKQFDLWGILFIALFLGPLEYVLGRGRTEDWFESERIAFWAMVAGISALLLLWRELTCSHPVINLRTFLNRNFSTGCLFNFVMGVGLFSSGYLMVLFLSQVKGYNSQQIGEVMSVPGIFMMASTPLVRIARRNLDARACLALGLMMLCSAFWINSSLTAEVGFEHLFVPQALRGVSIMFCLGPITELTLGRLPLEAVSNASGLFSLMRSLGGGIGIAVTSYLVEQRSALHYWRLVESINPDRFPRLLEQIQGSFAGRMSDLVQAQNGGIRMLTLLVRRESLVIANNDIWLMVAIMIGLMFLLVPFIQRIIPRT